MSNDSVYIENTDELLDENQRVISKKDKKYKEIKESADNQTLLMDEQSVSSGELLNG